jgi:16S rRNA (cytosine1402-N4)-methyltransferase
VEHLPVMFAETLQQLAIKEDGVYLDCTFGRGGHSRGILQALSDSGKLLALDRDWQAINSVEAGGMLKDDRFILKQGRFSDLEKIVVQQGWSGLVSGILMDIGVSSPQLDDAERGFSFLQDGPLDMRMDKIADESAELWLAKIKEKDLVKVLFEFGEERFARRIAKAVVEQREQTPITTTRQLAALIEKAVPFREKHKHPATRSFQAIRIAINHELEELKQALEQAATVLKPGGRLVVISFHSLEDRIVKRYFRNESRAKQNIGKLPIKEVDIDRGRLKIIGKALRANRQELDTNSRARSATMRVAERKV